MMDEADELDIETRRLAHRSRRYRFGFPEDREGWMLTLAEREPALHEELAALRRVSPQAWRKQLLREVTRLGLLKAE